MSLFQSRKIKPLPIRYQEFIRTQLDTIENILLDNNVGSEPARYHRDGLNQLLKGRPDNAIKHFYKAHLEYENIDVEQCTADLIKAKGDCILDYIIVLNIYDNIYELSDFESNSTLAFTYLWLSFEISHMKLFSSLVSLSELFLFFVEGNMIMASGFIQTMPPTYFPEFFSIVCHYWRNVYAAQALRSLGAGETRYLKKISLDLSQEEKKLKNYYESEIESADTLIEDLTTIISEKYSHLMPNLNNIDVDMMIEAITNPISSDENISYLELFDIMIRNIKKNSAGENITNMFKNIQITKEDAFQNENKYGLYTLIYTDIYNKENRNNDSNVSEELFDYAIQYFNNENYGIAGQIAKEALVFNRGSTKIKQFIEENSSSLLKKEMGIDNFDM